MSAPLCVVVGFAADLRRPAGFPHGLALIPGDDPLPDVGHSGLFLIDADCGALTLNDPALEGYITARIPITLHAEKLRDLRPFLRRKAAFRLRGYRVEALPG